MRVVRRDNGYGIGRSVGFLRHPRAGSVTVLRTIGGNIYCYRSVKRNGKVVSLYLGAGQAARKIEERFEAERAIKKAQRQRFEAAVESLREIESEIRELSALVRKATNEAMLVCCYYLNNRVWRRRKRKMSLPMPSKGREAGRLLDLAGDRSKLTDHLGGRLAKRIQDRLIARLSSDAVVQAEIRRDIEQMRRELEGDAPSVIERLVAERVVASWLHLAWAEAAFEVCGTDFEDLELATYADRMRLRAERSHLAALKSLETVRRAVPTIMVSVTNAGGEVPPTAGLPAPGCP